MNKLIAVSIGDINGIGLEIFLKLFLMKHIKDVVLFSNYKIIKKYIEKNKYRIKIAKVLENNNKIIIKKNLLNIYSFSCKSNIENTLKSVKLAHENCINKKFIGMVTLPLRKDLIINNIDPNFIGHTEYLRNLENKRNSNMILYHNKIIISPLTTHIKIQSVSQSIKKRNFIFNQLKNLNNTLKYDFNIKKPKILISGLNPHAGENGKIGKEEIKTIIPELKKLRKMKIDIDGPISADTMLIGKNTKNYNCFVFIYHDQALIPFKFISNFTGVNYTGNLKVVRTSPDHGTAYNLRNTKQISNKSLINSFTLIKKIHKNRIKNVKSKKIIKSKFFD